MVRSSCCDKLNAKKGGWVHEKDATNFSYPSKHVISNWSPVPRKIGPKRCGKNCRVKWSKNYVKPDLSHEGFTQHEEELIIKLHAAVGSRWGLIAHQLPGRTENDIKNHWNTKLRKKLTEMGIDPITHKPFSQILADYGNIGGISRSSEPPKSIGTIRKDLKKVVTSNLPKPALSFASPSYTFHSNSQNPHNISPIQHNNNTSSHSLGLLSQLHAISFVTEGQNNDFFGLNSNESLSNSSTSACSSSYKSPECFSWHDFLLEDAFKPAQKPALEQEGSSVTEYLVIPASGNGGTNYKNEIQGANNQVLPTSDGSSFLEAMLDQENDMFLSFPGLMEDPLY
ncbi:unnamed protein product [Amaranthus hypochondriacus]